VWCSLQDRKPGKNVGVLGPMPWPLGPKRRDLLVHPGGLNSTPRGGPLLRTALRLPFATSAWQVDGPQREDRNAVFRALPKAVTANGRIGGPPVIRFDVVLLKVSKTPAFSAYEGASASGR